jgi:hypothetical protein
MIVKLPKNITNLYDLDISIKCQHREIFSNDIFFDTSKFNYVALDCFLFTEGFSAEICYGELTMTVSFGTAVSLSKRELAPSVYENAWSDLIRFLSNLNTPALDGVILEAQTHLNMTAA